MSAAVTWIMFALASYALPPCALAQQFPAAGTLPTNGVVETRGWSTRPDEPGNAADSLAPQTLPPEVRDDPKTANQLNAASDISMPRMSTGDIVDLTPPPSETAAIVTNWIIASGDNGGLPFMVIDKVAASVLLFDAGGQFIGATPALLGITAGDDSVPGVGDRELSDIKPEDRTTPAGRFVAKFGLASGNRNVLWVDWETSISLHPVITTNKKERRLQRLRSPTPEDNRITFGCINVPAKFYHDMVIPLFSETSGIVYILPEFKYLFEVFPAFRPDMGPAVLGEGGR